MKTYTDRYEWDKRLVVTTEIFERELAAHINTNQVYMEVRSRLAEKITDMLWEKLEPTLKEVLKETE